MSDREHEGPPYSDPQDLRLLTPEWDTLFGFMIGRLLANGYTPAQIQAKSRCVADFVRDATRTPEGAQAAEDIQEGMDTLRKLVEGEDGE